MVTFFFFVTAGGEGTQVSPHLSFPLSGHSLTWAKRQKEAVPAVCPGPLCPTSPRGQCRAVPSVGCCGEQGTRATQSEQANAGDHGPLGQGAVPIGETQTGFHGNWGLEGWDRVVLGWSHLCGG